jgi:hypothetical protein
MHLLDHKTHLRAWSLRAEPLTGLGRSLRLVTLSRRADYGLHTNIELIPIRAKGCSKHLDHKMHLAGMVAASLQTLCFVVGALLAAPCLCDLEMVLIVYKPRTLVRSWQCRKDVQDGFSRDVCIL